MHSYPLITLVDQILTAKQKDPQSNTFALERQIDKIVYELYGLTPEEIAIVEGKKRHHKRYAQFNLNKAQGTSPPDFY